ncbi:hypothetical protein [Gordonia jinhuaensis]|uniref:hypothetical protein n=1 Tax=Gordonia jinhuaensis TaxID=1517702 RepID=UPI001662B265|nr:hypothetical protein [Gordonia jinhuaensis]
MAESVITRLSGQAWKVLNAELIPQVTEIYDTARPRFSARGLKIVDRSTATGSFGGDTACATLCEPAMVGALAGDTDMLYRVSQVMREVPFTGDFWTWEPIRGVHAATVRLLESAADPRVDEVSGYLSFADNGGEVGPPQFNQAMKNRLEGGLLTHFQTAGYARPLKLPQFSYFMRRASELEVMWAFGGSDAWPRTRLDQELRASRELVGDFYA